jgi:hypothetical protein
MQLVENCLVILDQLSHVTRQVKTPDFSMPSKALGGSTVGQHLRHTLEFFICLERGFEIGIVNYDNRQHDSFMETDKDFSLEVLARVKTFVSRTNGVRNLTLEVDHDRNGSLPQLIDTNYQRELSYNIEHAVHHMAIMKIGLREVAPYVCIPEDFGIAASTIRHKESMVSAQ